VAYPELEEVLRLVETGQRNAVVELISGVTEQQGVDLAVRLLAGVQIEVGHRWQSATWSVADEHIATAIVDLALAVVITGLRKGSSPVGSILFGCAEEEWHTTPARMMAAQLEARGWAVRFLGASLPSDHLVGYLDRNPVHAVALSCTVPIHLLGAHRLVAAAHSAGVPVLAGGRAFGDRAVRATSVGADAWAATADDADRILRTWLHNRPALNRAIDAGPSLALAAERPALVDDSMQILARRFPPLQHYTNDQVARTREDLEYIVRFLEASLLTGDDDVILDFIPWLVDCLDARGVPRRAVAMGLETLGEAIASSHRDAHRLLSVALEALSRIP
jgi:methanogenic corrinoid protein MtbC1